MRSVRGTNEKPQPPLITVESADLKSPPTDRRVTGPDRPFPDSTPKPAPGGGAPGSRDATARVRASGLTAARNPELERGGGGGGDRRQVRLVPSGQPGGLAVRQDPAGRP